MSLLLLCHFHFSLTTFDNNIRHGLLISNLWTSTQTHANQPFVTLELREKRFRSHKCFYCGSSGFFLANCPIWPKKCLPVCKFRDTGGWLLDKFETLSVFTSFTLFNLVTHSIHALIDSRAGQNLVDNELAKRFHLFLLLPFQTFPWFSVTWLQKHNPLTCQVMGLLAGASSVSLRKPVKLRNHQGLTSQLHVSQISITALTWPLSPFIVQQSLPSLICVIIMIIITPLGHTVFSHALWTHQCPGSVLNTGAWCFKGQLKHHCFCVLRWRPDFFFQVSRRAPTSF